MKKIIAIALFTFCCTAAMAQNPAIVKQQASEVGTALKNEKYESVVDHSYPTLVSQAGGKANMLKTLTMVMSQMKQKGVAIQSVVVGTPGKFYKAGNEIQCLIPETVTLTMPNGHIVNHANLFAASRDGGKFWYFIDINNGTYQQIPKMVTSFNKEMVIPAPTQPTVTPN